MLKLLPFLLFIPSCFAAGISVRGVSGDVRFNGKLVKVGQEIQVGGVMEVGSGDGDHVDLTYPEGHRLRLKKSARMQIADPEGPDANVLDLLKGQVFAYFVKGKGAEKYRIRTRAAIAGVRGTKFVVEENADNGTYVCVCEGVVNVAGINAHKADGSRDVRAGEDLWSHPGQPMGQPKASASMTSVTADEFRAMGVK